jgi:hypothetical protein
VLASVALTALLLPTSATPEARCAGDAEAFVDGAADSFTFAAGDEADVGASWLLVSPGGATLLLTKTASARSSDGVSFFLDGSPRAGATDQWSAVGDLDGAAADGTWTVAVAGFYASADSLTGVEAPGATLSVQGKEARFGADFFSPDTWVQTWNWHETNGTWEEPSTVPSIGIGGDGPAEGPEESPLDARVFLP